MQANAQLNIISREQADLSQVFRSSFNKEKSGHFLPYMYGNPKADSAWARFVAESDPDVQYTTKSEECSIRMGAPCIASTISNDPDFKNQEDLIFIENGSGSKEALENKSLVLMKAFKKAGMKIGMYSPWEGSEEYRRVAFNVVSAHGIHVNPMDVDFNNANPDISTGKVRNVERPRIVMEFGSSRGNIPTSGTDPRSFEEQAYAELQRRYANDKRKCRKGGYLILGTDATQGETARKAYVHEANAEFSKSIIHRGIEEEVLIGGIDPDNIKSVSFWTDEGHTVEQSLVFKTSQNFGVLNEKTGCYDAVSMKRDEHIVRSNSIKWPIETNIKAAKSQGLECKGVYWNMNGKGIFPIYLFKEMSLDEPKRNNVVKFNMK